MKYTLQDGTVVDGTPAEIAEFMALGKPVVNEAPTPRVRKANWEKPIPPVIIVKGQAMRVTPPRETILNVLRDFKGSPVHLHEIASYAELTVSQTSSHLNALSKMGLVAQHEKNAFWVAT